jgi:Protein of unknown function (DUF2897)
MVRMIIIIALVIAVLGGGLLALRRSARTGMPDADVLRRAQERADKERAADDDKR